MRQMLMIATAFSALALSAVTRPALAQEPTQTIKIALREDPDMLDPTLARSYVGRIVFAGMCDKLFDINDKLQIVPQLATSYDWADSKTLILHLRAGVKFQDETPMDAAAVVYNLERHYNLPGSSRKGEIISMDHAEVVDPLTVKVVLKSASAPFVSQLTDRAGMMVSPKAAEAEGKDFPNHPVCAGPFSFHERVAQDHITLDRFPDYWDAKDIHFAHVIYQTILNPAVRVANLQAGAIDMSEQIVPSDVDTVKKDPKLRIAMSDYLGYQSINFNVSHGDKANSPIGQDPRVRKAFELAIDRNALVQVVYNGMYSPVAQAVPALSPFYNQAVTPPGRDVAAARALLAQAGVKTPVTVVMTVPNSPDIVQLAEVIQSMTAEAGFDVKINSMEFASSLDAAVRGDFQAYMLAWSGRPDADGNEWNFVHTGGAQNYSGYSNKDVDGWLEDARTATSMAARKDLYGKVAVKIEQDLPVMYLFTQKNIVGLSAKVQGFVPVSDGMIRLQGVSLAK